MEKVTRKLTVQVGQVAKSHTTKDIVCDNKQLLKNLSLQVASIPISVVSLKLPLLGTDCLHYATTTLRCHTVSKTPTVVSSLLSGIFLPCTFSHPLKMDVCSLHSCHRKYGLSFLYTSLAFQNHDPSTLGPMELTFLYIELFILLGFVEQIKKKS